MLISGASISGVAISAMLAVGGGTLTGAGSATGQATVIGISSGAAIGMGSATGRATVVGVAGWSAAAVGTANGQATVFAASIFRPEWAMGSNVVVGAPAPQTITH